MVKEMYLDMRGVNGRLIQNTYWTNTDNPSKLALFFSGYRYPSEAPLFHFLKLHFLSKNWAVLTLDYRYNEDQIFLNLSAREQNTYIDTEALLIKKKLEDNLSFGQYCFMAKSLGTTLLCKMLQNDFIYMKDNENQFVWLTLGESNRDISDLILKKAIPSVYVVGDCDPYYEEKIVSRLKESPSCLCKVIPGAGHIFESKDSIDLTLENNFKVLRFLINEIKV